MAETPADRAKQFVLDRAASYRAAFPDYEKGAHLAFEDMKRFCRASESTFHPDARIAANLDGRREVYLRILDHLTLSPDALLAKYGVQPTKG